MINLADMTKHIRATIKRSGIKCNVSKTTTGSLKNSITVSRHPSKPFTVVEYRTICEIMVNNKFTGVKNSELNPNLFDALHDKSELTNQFNFCYSGPLI